MSKIKWANLWGEFNIAATDSRQDAFDNLKAEFTSLEAKLAIAVEELEAIVASGEYDCNNDPKAALAKIRGMG